MGKLPKQWFHWCKDMRLKPAVRRGKFRGFALVGRGYYFSIYLGRLSVLIEKGMGYSHIVYDDNGFLIDKLPTSRAQFRKAIRWLINESNHTRALEQNMQALKKLETTSNYYAFISSEERERVIASEVMRPEHMEQLIKQNFAAAPGKLFIAELNEGKLI